MEVFEAVRTVLAVREYEDKPVPADVVRRIVEAGRLTGSSQNGQPWHFIVVTDRDMLAQLGSVIRSGRYVAQAPLAIAVAVEPSRFGVSDASRAIQSMMLTAWGEGIGSNWTGFLGMEEVKRLLAVPEAFEMVAVLPFGYPKKNVGAGIKKRKPLGEVAHDGQFGRPFG